MLNNINQNTVKQQEQAFSLSSAKTNYWDVIPVEIFENIIFRLDITDIIKSRQLCRRIANIIDSSNYINELKMIEQAKKLFASIDTSIISTEAINKNFIEYIIQNCSPDNKELTRFKRLINKFNYKAVQFIFAKIMTNANYILKPILVLKEIYFNNDILFLSSRNFFITEDNNKFLYIKDNLLLLELITNNNKLEIIQPVFTARYGLLNLIQKHKNYIILSTHGLDGRYVIFLKKINDNYQNITPQDLNNVECKFIKMQFDKQGNTEFLIQIEKTFILYNTNDKNDINSVNFTKKSYQSELEIYDIINSKYNHLMIIYGLNSTSNKSEAHIYKYNKKIDTLIFETSYQKLIDSRYIVTQHELECSPQGDGLAIRDIDTENNLVIYSIYKIHHNKLKVVYTEKKYINKLRKNKETPFIYGNNGKNIIFNNNSNSMLYINANNKINQFDIADLKKYKFNKSGCMLLAQQEDNELLVYNFQSGTKKVSTIICKEKIKMAKFSPNSQLIAVAEETPYADLLIIYKIMSLDSKGNIAMLSKPKQVAEYCTNTIHYFKFHPDGTKLIIDEINQILILEINKADSNSEQTH